MADLLIVECLRDLPDEQLQHIFDYLKAQKETGVILLPPYLKAQIVPDNIEIKFIDILSIKYYFIVRYQFFTTLNILFL